MCSSDLVSLPSVQIFRLRLRLIWLCGLCINEENRQGGEGIMKHREQGPKGKDKIQFSEQEIEAQVRDANPLNDVLFKYLFASKENKENLIRLLNDVLGPERRIVDVESLDRENDPRRYEGRASFLDVLARSDDGRIFHVEVQLSDEGNFFERVTYYAE